MLKNVNKYKLYMNAFNNTLQEYLKLKGEKSDINPRPFIKKIIIYGVKAVNTKKDSEYIIRKEVEYDFKFVSVIKYAMEVLTPKEFMRLFPIEKEYKGHKYEMKDYFYTRDYIKSLDSSKLIGEEILEFLWEYQNREITKFNIKVMKYISRLRRLDGQTSLAEEFANIMEVKTYTRHTDLNGTQFLFDKEAGKTIKLNKSIPQYLKVLK